MTEEDEPIAANTDEWPWMPENVARLNAPPHVGQWVWFVPSRPRHTSFHEVKAIEVLEEEDEEPIDLVVSTCGHAWPVDDFSLAIDGLHPVLRRSQDGVNARCPNCANERLGGTNQWVKRLRAARRAQAAT